MSTIITDNPYTFTVADNMNINAVFEDLPLIEVIATTKNYSLNGAPEICTLGCTSLKTGYINLKSNSSSNDYLSFTFFDKNPNMESITIASPRFMKATSTEYDVFPDTNDCPIYVPSNLLNTYKTNSYWKKAASRFQAIP